MKKLLIAMVVLAIVAAAIRRGYPALQTLMTHTIQTGDVLEGSGTVVANPDMSGTIDETNNTTESTVVDEEFKAKLEAQQNIVLSGDKVTEDDIKLIEDILKQITDGTNNK